MWRCSNRAYSINRYYAKSRQKFSEITFYKTQYVPSHCQNLLYPAFGEGLDFLFRECVVVEAEFINDAFCSDTAGPGANPHRQLVEGQFAGQLGLAVKCAVNVKLYRPAVADLSDVVPLVIGNYFSPIKSILIVPHHCNRACHLDPDVDSSAGAFFRPLDAIFPYNVVVVVSLLEFYPGADCEICSVEEIIVRDDDVAFAVILNCLSPFTINPLQVRLNNRVIFSNGIFSNRTFSLIKAPVAFQALAFAGPVVNHRAARDKYRQDKRRNKNTIHPFFNHFRSFHKMFVRFPFGRP